MHPAPARDNMKEIYLHNKAADPELINLYMGGCRSRVFHMDPDPALDLKKNPGSDVNLTKRRSKFIGFTACKA